VLKPGGRISLAEPLNRDYLALGALHPNELFGYDIGNVAAAFRRSPDED